MNHSPANITVTIPTEDQDRFQREIVANSPDSGISPPDQEAALHAFVRMYASAGTDTVDGAIIALWQEGVYQMAWQDSQMVLMLDKPAEETA